MSRRSHFESPPKPEMPKPQVKVKQSYIRRVTMELTEKQLEYMVLEYLRRHVPSFRGTKFELQIDCGGYEGCQFKCTAIGVAERNENG